MTRCEITEVRDVQIGGDIYTRIWNEEFGTVEYLDNRSRIRNDSNETGYTGPDPWGVTYVDPEGVRRIKPNLGNTKR